jgi:phospholipase C
VPPANQALPEQEKGVRPARPVPYKLSAHGSANFEDGTFSIHFGNQGKTAVYQVRSGNSSQGPWSYTVGQGAHVSDTYAITANNLTAYDLSVYGPNGFLRAFKGSVTGPGKANLDVRTTVDTEDNRITVSAANHGGAAVTITLTNGYGGATVSSHVAAGATGSHTFNLNSTHGWYDVTVEVVQDASFRYQIAGHVETGEESFTDPAIASYAS